MLVKTSIHCAMRGGPWFSRRSVQRWVMRKTVERRADAASSEVHHMDRIEIFVGDITKLKTDVIVNAASHSLQGRSGLSKVIFDAAGPELWEACGRIGGRESGDVEVTLGYNLSSKWIFHAIGPVWYGGFDGEEETLLSCYIKCFRLARSLEVASMAFPSLSTGAHGFPAEIAARIACSAFLDGLSTVPTLEKIFIALIDSKIAEIYTKYLRG